MSKHNIEFDYAVSIRYPITIPMIIAFFIVFGVRHVFYKPDYLNSAIIMTIYLFGIYILQMHLPKIYVKGDIFRYKKKEISVSDIQYLKLTKADVISIYVNGKKFADFNYSGENGNKLFAKLLENKIPIVDNRSKGLKEWADNHGITI